MTADVVKLVPQEIGAGFRLDSDVILENMKGKTYSRLLIIGEMEDGSREIQGNCNSGEALFLMELAKHDMVFGDEE